MDQFHNGFNVGSDDLVFANFAKSAKKVRNHKFREICEKARKYPSQDWQISRNLLDSRNQLITWTVTNFAKFVKIQGERLITTMTNFAKFVIYGRKRTHYNNNKFREICWKYGTDLLQKFTNFAKFVKASKRLITILTNFAKFVINWTTYYKINKFREIC